MHHDFMPYSSRSVHVLPFLRHKLSQSNAAIGDIRETYIFNYLFDLEWMVAQLPQLASLPAVHLIGNDLSMVRSHFVGLVAAAHSPQLELIQNRPVLIASLLPNRPTPNL